MIIFILYSLLYMCNNFTQIRDNDILGQVPGHSYILRTVVNPLRVARVGLDVATLGTRDGLIKETEVPDKTSGIVAVEMG